MRINGARVVVLFLGICVVCIGFGRPKVLSTTALDELRGGGAGECIGTVDCAEACHGPSTANSCWACKDTTPYDDCVASEDVLDWCADYYPILDPPLYCGTVYGGDWDPDTEQCDDCPNAATFHCERIPEFEVESEPCDPS